MVLLGFVGFITFIFTLSLLAVYFIDRISGD